MRTLVGRIAVLACLVAVAGCTTNKSIANITTSKATLEMAVGTINDSADTLGIGGTTLNVVTSFRNVLGNSAYENPGNYSLTGPGGSIVAPSGGTSCDTGFSTDQLFSYGLAPGCVAIPGASSVVLNVWGMPPTYTPPDAVGGYSLGFIPTGAAATAGSYTVSTAVPVNGGMPTYSATASLPASPVVLPNATGVTGFVSDGKGGGTFTIGNPSRPHGAHTKGVINTISEYLIIAVNPFTGTLATVETTNTTATITGTGDCSSSTGGIPISCGSFSAFVIGADYPMVEDGPPANLSPAPSLVGPKGEDDITISGINNGLTE